MDEFNIWHSEWRVKFQSLKRDHIQKFEKSPSRFFFVV